MTQGAYLHRDHLALQVKIEGVVNLAVPIHNLHAVSVFGNVFARDVDRGSDGGR